MGEMMVESPHVLRTAFTRFEEGVAKMMKRNGIRTAPEVKVSPFSVMGTSPAALTVEAGKPPVIHITEQLAQYGDTPVAMGAVAHETGHLLADHSVGITFGKLLVDTKHPELLSLDLVKPNNVPGIIGKIGAFKHNFGELKRFGNYQKTLVGAYKAQEHEADQFMTHMLGSHDDALSVRRTMTLGSELVPFYKHTTALGQIFSPVSRALQRHNVQKLYGSPQELEANILRVNLKDRSHVDRLIAEREATITNERIK